jgi:hypothetical protein
MVVTYTQRPHGNHNPQHGGQFFMAPDNWHHVEGTLPQARLVRIYLYDDYTKPLPGDQMKPIQGRVIMKSGTRDVSFPLAPSRNGTYLEARVDSRARALPASIVAKIKLKPDAPEYHFDFLFTEFSKDDAVNRVTRPTAAPPVVKKDPEPSPVPIESPPLVQVSIPETVGEIVAQIGTRNRQIAELINLGRFSEAA